MEFIRQRPNLQRLERLQALNFLVPFQSPFAVTLDQTLASRGRRLVAHLCTANSQHFWTLLRVMGKQLSQAPKAKMEDAPQVQVELLVSVPNFFLSTLWTHCSTFPSMINQLSWLYVSAVVQDSARTDPGLTFPLQAPKPRPLDTHGREVAKVGNKRREEMVSF